MYALNTENQVSNNSKAGEPSPSPEAGFSTNTHFVSVPTVSKRMLFLTGVFVLSCLLGLAVALGVTLSDTEETSVSSSKLSGTWKTVCQVDPAYEDYGFKGTSQETAVFDGDFVSFLFNGFLSENCDPSTLIGSLEANFSIVSYDVNEINLAAISIYSTPYDILGLLGLQQICPDISHTIGEPSDLSNGCAFQYKPISECPIRYLSYGTKGNGLALPSDIIYQETDEGPSGCSSEERIDITEGAAFEVFFLTSDSDPIVDELKQLNEVIGSWQTPCTYDPSYEAYNFTGSSLETVNITRNTLSVSFEGFLGSDCNSSSTVGVLRATFEIEKFRDGLMNLAPVELTSTPYDSIGLNGLEFICPNRNVSIGVESDISGGCSRVYGLRYCTYFS